jgi:hypothetical protein
MERANAYIPGDIRDKVEGTYLDSQSKLRKAGQDEFEKNRYFYPLRVQFRIEALSGAEAEEIQARLSNLGRESVRTRRVSISQVARICGMTTGFYSSDTWSRRF